MNCGVWAVLPLPVFSVRMMIWFLWYTLRKSCRFAAQSKRFNLPSLVATISEETFRYFIFQIEFSSEIGR